MIQKGFQNEKDFVKEIDGKYLKNLNKNIKNLLYKIFVNINENSKVECWQSKYYEKADIKIRINNEIKGISIKTGNYCSIHQENIDKFEKYLIRIGVENNIIKILKEFVTGVIDEKKVNSATYIEKNIKDIEKLNISFNEYYIKANLISRFLFQGTENQLYVADALIYGIPSSFIWATKNEILKFLLEYNQEVSKQITVSALTIKCYDRNLRNNPNRIKSENEIQVKWINLKKDLLNITKLREAEKSIEYEQRY